MIKAFLIIVIAVAVSVVAASALQPAIQFPTSGITFQGGAGLSDASVKQSLHRIDEDLLEKNAETLDGEDWDSVTSISVGTAVIDILTTRVHMNEYRVDLNVLGDANISGDLNVMGDANFVAVGIGSDSAEDPAIWFYADGGGGLMWFEDVGNRFNFDYGITVDGSFEGDELVTQSWRAGIGDYINYDSADNNWGMIIGDEEVFGVNADDANFSTNVGIAGDLYVDGNITFSAGVFVSEDLNVWGDANATNLGVSSGLYANNITGIGDINFYNISTAKDIFVGDSVYAINKLRGAYISSRFVGAIDMRADPWSIFDTGVEITTGDFEVATGDSNFVNIGITGKIHTTQDELTIYSGGGGWYGLALVPNTTDDGYLYSYDSAKNHFAGMQFQWSDVAGEDHLIIFTEDGDIQIDPAADSGEERTVEVMGKLDVWDDTNAINIGISGGAWIEGDLNVAGIDSNMNNLGISGVLYGGTPLEINDDVNITGDLNVSGLASFQTQVVKYHRVQKLDTASTDWNAILWDLNISEETTKGFNLIDNNQGIRTDFTGIVRIQGCVHPKFNAGSAANAKLSIRVLVDGVEIRCLQASEYKERIANQIGILSFAGTAYVSDSNITVQYKVDNANLDLEGDTDFDVPVAASINIEKISVG